MIDLGNAEAVRYLHQFISAAVQKYRLDVWRVDFNTNPAVVWARTGDVHTAPVNASSHDYRRGVNEAGYVRALYKLWDRVRLSHPGLIIDNCASGGRRHDLETMSRSIPLWPCGNFDTIWDPFLISAPPRSRRVMFVLRFVHVICPPALMSSWR